MSTQGASTSSPSSSSTPRQTYEVFLSFRGKDTRKSFTDHLYNALIRKGIFTFRDDENLERGRSISQELVKAIEESKFAVVILSINYAFSTWCLDELVHIVRCMEETGLEVMPIFYHVNASDVREQTGTFAKAFDKHEKKALDEREMERWRKALRVVANLSGWDLKNRYESKFIQEIVEEIHKKLNSKFLIIHKNLVGVESMVAKLIPLFLDFGNNVCMIGICGMGGIGKTTLARVVYDMYSNSNKFDASSFIANVRENSVGKDGLLQLQKQLLKDILGAINIDITDDCQGVNIIKNSLYQKKVLLVLDDVNHVNQLENLAGEHHWFGSGSWIIITTRDEHVLAEHGVLKIYKPDVLNNDDALQLFCSKAFKNEQPKEGYMQLSQEFVEYAGGLPLALVTLGSFLVRRTIDDWQSALDHFKKNPPKEIFDILKISFDGLEDMWKEVFLDIACFFTGQFKFKVIRILENCGFEARIIISVLQEKSLLTVIGEELWMHDLLQEMGEKIVRQQSFGELGRQSRLWLIEDLFHVLENNMATNAIQAIVIKKRKADFNFEEFPEVFSKMTNLRLLIIDGLNIPNALNRVPNGLRHLSWIFCPLKRLPSSFQPKELVELDLQYSKCEDLWKGAKCLGNLKSINLCCCVSLTNLPGFSEATRLEVLDLDGCTNLVGLHPSIGQLSKLKSLNLSRCVSLTNLPSFSEATRLEVLDLDGCTNLVGLHPSIGQLSKLKSLNLSRCESLTSLPSFSEATRLEVLGLDGCTNLVGLHPSIGQLSKLKSLSLSGCESLTSLPSFSEATRLEKLSLNVCTNLVGLHPSIGQLSKLKSLSLSDCESLTSLPSFSEATGLEVLDLDGCTNLVGLHPSIGQLSKLKSLSLWCCESLTSLPSFSEATGLEVLGLGGCTNLVGLHPSIGQLSKLKSLSLWRCKSLTSLPSFSEATGLEVLGLGGCTNLVGLHPSIGQLSKLKSLNLCYCESLNSLPSFSEATGLEVLNLDGCTNLVGLHPSIGQLSKLKSLNLCRCESLTSLPSFSEATGLEVLGLDGCTNLVGLHPSIGQLSKLQSLNLYRCESLNSLPSFSEATGLQVLGLDGCTNLVGLHPSIGQLSKLKSLNLYRCESLNSLPSFSEATGLVVLGLDGCTNLVGLHPSIGQLSKLKSLNLYRCESLTSLPSFSEATGLEVLGLDGCTNLVGLHPSIGQLSKLKSLNLCRCESLTSLPSFSEATGLEVLGLDGCTNLVGLHPSIGQLSKLKSLNLCRCESLTSLPSFSEATGLEVLGLDGCTNLVGLHPSIGQLSKLESLNLCRCESLTSLPSFSEATGLEVLGLDGCTNLVGLHPSIGQLSKLESLNLYRCKSLTSLPSFSEATRLEVLGLEWCTNLVGLHPSIGQLSKLRSLDLRGCGSLTNLPSLSAKMESLTSIVLSECSKIEKFPEFKGTMKSLSQIAWDCPAIEEIPCSSIECLTALESLGLIGCKDLECLPSNMDSLRSLKLFCLSGCSKLANLPENLWKIKCLETLALDGVSQLEEIELNGIGCLSSLKYLSLSWNNFVTLPAIFSQLSKLETLNLCGCKKLRSVPELPSTMRYINMVGCCSLEPSPGLLRQNSLPRSYSSPFFRGYDESSGGVAFTILKRYLQGLLCEKTGYETATKRKEDGSKTEFQIFIPGCLVPRWLTHQSRGNSISVVLPPNWCNSRWMGFALCALFSGEADFSGELIAYLKAIGDMPHSRYVFKNLEFGGCSENPVYSFRYDWFSTVGDSECKQIENHVWLLYLSRDDWFSTVGIGECSQIEVVFENESGSAFLVQQCGVSLVYEQDMELMKELNQANAQCSNSSRVITYEGWDGFHHGFANSKGSSDESDDYAFI